MHVTEHSMINIHSAPLFVQWLADVNQKVMLENGDPVPVVMLANKVPTVASVCVCGGGGGGGGSLVAEWYSL